MFFEPKSDSDFCRVSQLQQGFFKKASVEYRYPESGLIGVVSDNPDCISNDRCNDSGFIVKLSGSVGIAT